MCVSVHMVLWGLDGCSWKISLSVLEQYQFLFQFHVPDTASSFTKLDSWMWHMVLQNWKEGRTQHLWWDSVKVRRQRLCRFNGSAQRYGRPCYRLLNLVRPDFIWWGAQLLHWFIKTKLGLRQDLRFSTLVNPQQFSEHWEALWAL